MLTIVHFVFAAEMIICDIVIVKNAIFIGAGNVAIGFS
jgi:hypothetical protein